jgi:hypothetical protein
MEPKNQDATHFRFVFDRQILFIIAQVFRYSGGDRQDTRQPQSHRRTFTQLASGAVKILVYAMTRPEAISALETRAPKKSEVLPCAKIY